MLVERWPIERLRPYEQNAQKHPKKQIEKLAKLIERHGFDVFIVAEPDGTIIKGHARLEAAKLLGLKTVPVIVRGDLSPAMIREARIADNRIPTFGKLDKDLLLADVKVAMNLDDFQLDMTLFSKKELGLETIEVRGHARGLGTKKYRVVVECEDDDAQTKLVEELEARGYECRLA